MADSPIPCGIIGLGRIGSVLEDDALREKPATHAGAIYHHPETYIACGCDTDAEARTRFGERWHVDALYHDAQTMLQQSKPQIVCIATPTASHNALLGLALESQIPVVVCEKPITEKSAHAKRMARRVAGSHTTVIVNHERRYAKDYARVRHHIVNGTYGQLRSVAANVYMGKTRPIPDIVLHDGTHMFDIIRFLTGEEIRLNGVESHPKTHPYTTVVTGCVGDALITVEVGTSRDHLVFELSLSFQSGKITIGNGTYVEEASLQSELYEGFKSLHMVDTEAIPETGYFAGMFADAVACLKNPSRVPISSYSDGVKSLLLIDRVKRLMR